MAKKRKKRSSKLKGQQYRQIIFNSRTKAEERLQRLGLLPQKFHGIPDARRLAVQAASMEKDAEALLNSSAPDLSRLKEKDRILAYYARPDVQREMHRYAKGRYLTVLRSFSSMFPELRSADDVLPLMFHYLKGNRWPSMHGTISRYNEAGKKVCDFVFETDFKKNWAVAFGAARPIVQLFLRMGLPFFLKFSGNTSPHIVVPAEALATAGEEEMNKSDFREQVYAFVLSRMNKPGLLDGPNMKPGHFLRLVYSIHELGGKVSMPIKPQEFDSFNPSMAQIENVVVVENWWHIPEDAAERGKAFVEQVLKSYPRLVRGTDKLKPVHKWKPPETPHKLRQIVDANGYAKMLQSGQRLLRTARTENTAHPQQSGEETLSDTMVDALTMVRRWEKAGMKINLEAAAGVFEVDVGELRSQWQPQETHTETEFCQKTRFLNRSEIQEIFYRYATGRCFRLADSKAHFRMQKPSDIPLLATHFESSEDNWGGFECTKAKYNLMDNTIAACDIGIEVDFSRSDYISAVELAQKLIAVLQKYEIFCFLKFNGDEILELIIPAEALPGQIDGQKTALKMHQIASGLHRGFRQMPEVSGNDCYLIIQPYGYTRPAYSLNPKTGLACVVLTPADLQDFSPEYANSDFVSINTSWLNIPAKASLQAQRFLKYVLSPNWQPV